MDKEPDPASRYRAGARDGQARAGKAAADRDRRRALADAAFPAERRKAILDGVQSGFRLSEVARANGVSVQSIYGLADRDPTFAEALDAAQRRAAPADCPHGTPTGYRWYGCHCRACRSAKHGPRPIQTFGAGRASREQLRAELERIAAARGFADWETLIRETRHMSGRKLARMVGRSGNSISRWRHLILDQEEPPDATRLLPVHKQSPAWAQWRQERAQAAGYTSWEAAVRAAGESSVPHIAKQLRVDSSVIYRWRNLLKEAEG